MPEGVPLQSLSRPSGWPTVWRSAPAPKVPSPFDDITRSGPVCGRPSGSDTVPTPGFLTPSPVSWLRSSLRVCFAPQPSLGFAPFRAFPSRQVAHPSSGPLAPLPFFPVEPRCGVRGLVAHDLHRLGRRSGVVPGQILSELEAPFQPRSPRCLAAPRLAEPPGHPGPRTPDSPRSGRSVDFEAFFPARVRSHRASSPSRVVRAEAGALLGVPRPSRALLPPDLGPSHPPRPEASLLPLAARASRRVARLRGLPASGHLSWLAPRALRCWKPSKSGGIARGRPKRPARPVGGHRIPRPGPCCPSAAASTPMTFDARANPRPSRALDWRSRLVTHQV